VTIERQSKEGMSAPAHQPNAPAPTIIGLAGWSGSGKTTVALKLIAALKGRGLRVATLKHAHHGFDVDVPGKDSFAHRQAGADEVIVASSQRIAHMIEAPLPDPDDRRTLASLLPRLGVVDVVVVEGFKTAPHPKLEIYRPELGKPRLLGQVPNIVAVASPGMRDEGSTSSEAGNQIPVFDLNAIEDSLDALLSLFGQSA